MSEATGEPSGETPPLTAQEAALAWVDAVMDQGDLRLAWPLTDPTLRLVLAQDWVWTRRHDPAIGHNADWEGIARGLAADPSVHALWDRFADDVITLWQKIWNDFGTRTWRPWDSPEVLSLDLEMVTFVETGGEAVPARPRRSGGLSRRFALRHGDAGWMVASVNGDQMFVPGWPPTMEQQPG